MSRSVYRRVIALVVAYGVALDPVVPLAATFASAADAFTFAELCATDQAGSPADVPDKARPDCPLACSASGCGANGLLAGPSFTVPAFAGAAPATLFIGRDQ